jgi:iron(III) transport system ATP-binding protein
MSTEIIERSQGNHAMTHVTPDVEPSASLQAIRKTFVSKGKTVHAVKDVDLHITPGEYVVVLGPSGCGKSTLIRCIAGLESPTTGSIELLGRKVYDAKQSINMKANARNVGMVFQSYALWPHMTIEQNVAYPLKMRKVPKKEREERVAAVLKALEVEQLAKRLPAELSGGQQQRIALARALVYEPAILLLDEPLSNLDALLRVSLRAELLRLHRQLGYTALHITHDQEEALEMGDRVVLMREGEIEQMGPPEEVYARPVSPYAATFLGVRNKHTVTIRNGLLEYAGGVVAGSEQLAAGHPDGTRLQLFVRGRDTHVARASNSSTDNAEHIELQGTLAQTVLGEGGRRQYVLDIHGDQWFAQNAEGPQLEVGDTTRVTVPVTKVLLYRDEELVFPL